MTSTRIVFISDTHGHHDFEIPDGDLLIHCGDGTSRGTGSEVRRWGEWMLSLPHESKVFIAGNHDFLFENNLDAALAFFGRPFGGPPSLPGMAWIVDGLTYLQGATVSVSAHGQSAHGRRLRIHGSPWQPAFYDWAFNLPRGPKLAEKWDLIPHGLDVLVTHGPPHGILDLVDNRPGHVGCADLMRRVEDTAPRIHAFGHIHEQHGTEVVGNTLFVNAAICTTSYKPTQRPIAVDLPHDRSLAPVVVSK